MNAPVTKKKTISAIVAVLILMSLMVPVAMAAPPPLVLPPDPIAPTWTEYDLNNQASPALFGITLSGFSGNYSVNTNTNYNGWCVEYSLPVPTTNPVTLYSTYDTNLPADAQTYTDPQTPIVLSNTSLLGQPVPWDKLNYLLNHKQGTAQEIQTAIWLLIWGESPFAVTPNVTAMLTAANASVNFVPAPGQIIAVLLYIDGIGHDPNTEWQETVIELTVPSYDLGDLPATYPTLLANNGPSHQLGQNLFLGQCVDGELDGQPNATATGDDTAVGSPVSGTPSCIDDEDGVTPVAGKGGAGNGVGWTVGTVVAGGGGAVQVTITGGPVCLGAFFDFAHSGTTLTPAPLLDTNGAAVTQPIAVGTPTFYFDIPANTFNGQPIYARFRVTSPVSNACAPASPVFSPTGPAPDGEVEDYQWNFNPTAVTLSGISASSAASPVALPLGIVTILGVLLGGIVLVRRPL